MNKLENIKESIYLLTDKDRSNLVIFSIIITILTFLISLFSILWQDTIYLTKTVVTSFLPTDIINLVITVPLLSFLIYKSSQSSFLGILSLLGMIWYNLYVYVMYSIAITPHFLTLGYLLIIAISLYTVIGTLIKLNHENSLTIFNKPKSILLTGIILFLIGLIFLIRQIIEMYQSFQNSKVIDSITTGQWFSDFVIFGFSMLIGGILLLKRTNIGFSVSPGLLLGGCIAFLGLIPFLIIQSILESVAIDWFGLFFVLIFGLILFIPYFYYFIRK